MLYYVLYVYMYVYIYIYIYIYIYRRAARTSPASCRTVTGSCTDGIGNARRPQPDKFGKLVSLITSSQSYMFLN